MKNKKIWLIVACLFVLIALSWHFFFSHWFIRLDDSYVFTAAHIGNTQLYDESKSQWSDLDERMIRNDVVVQEVDDALVIRSVFRGINPNGDILFEASSRYGVNPYTKENISGTGDESRSGQFGFPFFTEKKDYLFHSPEIVEAPALARFVGVEPREDMELYRFEFTIDDLNKTQFFPDFLSAGKTVMGNHSGILWVEPVSGTIVDFHHSGDNWILGKDTVPFQHWFNQFSYDTVSQNIASARSFRNAIYTQIYAIPIIFLCFSFISLILFFRKKS